MVGSVMIPFQVSIIDGLIWDEDGDEDWIEAPADYGSEEMQASPILRFALTYPLNNPKSVVFTHADGTGWSRRQFVDAVRAAYQTLYDEESAHPGYFEGMLNRAQSPGPYQIWGHDISELALEGAQLLSDGSWHLSMGS